MRQAMQIKELKILKSKDFFMHIFERKQLNPFLDSEKLRKFCKHIL